MSIIDNIINGMKAGYHETEHAFGTSFDPDFQPFTITATTTRQLVFTPTAHGTKLAWLGIGVRSMGTANIVYVGVGMTGDGKAIPTKFSYYERGTDHRPVSADYYTVWTDTGTATVEVDGEYW